MYTGKEKKKKKLLNKPMSTPVGFSHHTIAAIGTNESGTNIPRTDLVVS